MPEHSSSSSRPTPTPAIALTGKTRYPILWYRFLSGSATSPAPGKSILLITKAGLIRLDSPSSRRRSTSSGLAWGSLAATTMNARSRFAARTLCTRLPRLRLTSSLVRCSTLSMAQPSSNCSRETLSPMTILSFFAPPNFSLPRSDASTTRPSSSRTR